MRTHDEQTFPIIAIVADDEKGDLVRVSVNIPQEKFISLSLDTVLPRVGERVVVIGSPLGYEGSVSDGIVSGVREIPEMGKCIQITAATSSKVASGSPLVNLSGKVIGIVLSQSVFGQNLNFAVPAARLNNLQPGEAIPLC